jgi:hypothetical protein
MGRKNRETKRLECRGSKMSDYIEDDEEDNNDLKIDHETPKWVMFIFSIIAILLFFGLIFWRILLYVNYQR